MKKARQKTPIGENLLTLRHRMKMTQSEFIDMFFKDEEGTPMLSVAKLSNLETKGNRDEEMLAEKVAGKLSLDPALFSLSPDDFAKNIDVFMEKANPQLPVGIEPKAIQPGQLYRQCGGGPQRLPGGEYFLRQTSARQPPASDRAFAEMLGPVPVPLCGRR